MSNRPVNVVGEPFKDYVRDQINVRQKVHGKGIGGTKRTQDEISYLNASNAFIKVASSVSVTDIERLTKIGFSESEAKELMQNGLAENFVLFNGTSRVGDPLQRSGVSGNNSMLSPKLYGTGGTEFGLQAMPGIIGLNVAHNNLGSIKTGQLVLRANSTQQFNILELLYVRLGYTILVEWGKGFYFDNDNNLVQQGATLIDDTKNGWFSQKGTTHLEFYDKIDKRREESNGNYDAFFCKVKNFDWSFNPEGYYEVTLDLISLGDVVESFKLDSLTPINSIASSEDGEDEEGSDQSQANISDLGNFIYCSLKDFTKQAEKFGESNYVSIGSSKTELVSSGIGNTGQTRTKSNIKYFIRLGTFLEWIENNVVVHHKNGDSKPFPMIDINTSGDNFMRIFKGLVSTNPKICIIKNDLPTGPDGKKIGTKIAEDTLAAMDDIRGRGEIGFKQTSEDIGRIMNIYLNIEYIKELSESELSNRKLDFLSFFNKMCSDLNSCFGTYIELFPTIQNDKEFIIRDAKLDVGTGSDGSTIPAEEKSPELKLYGYDLDKKESNFVRNFSFNTKISNDLSTMIAIGSTANNETTIEVSDFFNNLNRGLTDRFKQEAKDGNEEAKDKLECASDKKPAKKINFAWEGFKAATSFIFGFNNTGNDNPPPPPPTMYEEYRRYLSKMFGNPTLYLETEPSDITRGSSALEGYIKDYYRYVSKDSDYKTSSSTLGFIPIDLDITLDGISGIRIWNQLNVDSKFLPQDYPDKIEFVIKGITHTLQDGQWTTTISALSKPKSNLVGVTMELVDVETIDDSKDSVIDTESTIEDLTFYPPVESVGLDPADPFFYAVRNDDGGRGAFGESRGTRSHGGIDLSTSVGMEVRASITGTAYITKATATSRLRGVKIVGSGKYAGITTFVFYIEPDPKVLPSPGDFKKVNKGDIIGRAVELSLPQGDYPENVENHIHFAVEKAGVKVNPENLKYVRV